MRTAVGASVILDVLTNDPRFADASESAIRRAAAEGTLIIGECVLAEIVPALRDHDVTDFLSDWGLAFVPSSRESVMLAGEMIARHLSRRKPAASKRVTADFLIGAHAQLFADRLLSRDRGFFRDYFRALTVVRP